MEELNGYVECNSNRSKKMAKTGKPPDGTTSAMLRKYPFLMISQRLFLLFAWPSKVGERLEFRRVKTMFDANYCTRGFGAREGTVGCRHGGNLTIPGICDSAPCAGQVRRGGSYVPTVDRYRGADDEPGGSHLRLSPERPGGSAETQGGRRRFP